MLSTFRGPRLRFTRACPDCQFADLLPAFLQAFAAVGTMEGSWFTATGEPRSFSEQQLIDCAWPHGPHGCDGGDYQVSTQP